MTKQEELNFIKNYLEKYFDKWIINDIAIIRKNDPQFTIPYILLVSSGIDFLGMLEQGFKINKQGEVRERFCYFIENWMGNENINSLYKDKRMSKVIYKSARCGLSHQTIFKQEIGSLSNPHLQNKHLHCYKDSDGKDKIFIHALQFVDDFNKAQKLFREQYIEENINEVYNNLQNMLKEKNSDFADLILYLENKGFTFNMPDDCSPSAAPSNTS